MDGQPATPIEIVNLDPLTHFTHLALDGEGAMLAIVDNFKSIIIMQRVPEHVQRIRQHQNSWHKAPPSLLADLPPVYPPTTLSEKKASRIQWEVHGELELPPHLKHLEVMQLSFLENGTSSRLGLVLEAGVVVSFDVHTFQLHEGQFDETYDDDLQFADMEGDISIEVIIFMAILFGLGVLFHDDSYRDLFALFGTPNDT
jgi:hypothetical protein